MGTGLSFHDPEIVLANGGYRADSDWVARGTECSTERLNSSEQEKDLDCRKSAGRF